MELSAQQYQQLRLFRSRGVGPVIYRKLMDKYGSALSAIESFDDLNKQYKKSLKAASEKEIDTELKNLEKINASLVFYEDELFPTALKFIHDCPPVLSVLGNAKLLGMQQVAIVGNRKASSPAMAFTQKIAQELCAENYVITSGLARGIDSAAHQGALSVNGLTLAVLAGGIDHIYPPENEGLYEKIAQTGAVISEMPLGMTPTQNHFPRRNRIVSGLSLGTFVVEAAKKSGSLITARLASEQGREVFAMPGSPVDKRSSGPNYLIQNGATMVQDVKDILENLPKMVTGYQAQYQQTLSLEPIKEEGLNDHLKSPSYESVEVKVHNYSTQSSENPLEVDDLKVSVLDALTSTPTGMDELIRMLGVSEPLILECLCDLEMDEKVQRQPFGFVKI